MNCPLCENESSNEHVVEEVVFDDVKFDVAIAVITDDRQGIPCAYHEKIIIIIAAMQIKDRAMRDSDDIS